MNAPHIPISDTIAGYVTTADADVGVFGLRTSDGQEFQVRLTDTTYAELIRNLDEPWQDPDVSVPSLLQPERFLFAHGLYYPEAAGISFEAKHVVLVGQTESDWRFEMPDWWVRQIDCLAEWYYKAEFPDGQIDYHAYRTNLSLEGQKIENPRQETDTISRMIYGFATAYLLTGQDRYLDAAMRGTEYLRDHMRAVDENREVVYWYHAIDIDGLHKRKILASEFGDDYEAIPAYEQIYALAGPIQTYRVTGDPRIRADADRTINLFDRFFLDHDKGGYFSHIDPVTFDPRAASLTHNRAKKNWNSVGDHAPAYLINLYLATGEQRYAEMLATLAGTVVTHFPDYDHSPFVNEKFLEDWTPDHETPLQKNRAIVGHNLKIAWNLVRISHLHPDGHYLELARKIADLMSRCGMDPVRGGVYDMVEREKAPGQDFHRLVWHDHKTWWQQEQGILAYLILAGSLRQPEDLRRARETAAFYNAWFLDHEAGAVYFSVLANGIPFLLGTERLKGSHAMSGYHAFELCYLAAVYTNLLLTKQPLTLYFKPQVGGFPDNVLRVQPDILPAGSAKIESVWINDEPYADFDAGAMTIRLPASHTAPSPHPLAYRPPWLVNPRLLPPTSREQLRVRVRIAPAAETYDFEFSAANGAVELKVSGDLPNDAVVPFQRQLDRVVVAQPKRFIVRLDALQSLSDECARAFAFTRSKLDVDTDIYLVGANQAVQATLRDTAFLEGLIVQDMYDPNGAGK